MLTCKCQHTKCIFWQKFDRWTGTIQTYENGNRRLLQEQYYAKAPAWFIAFSLTLSSFLLLQLGTRLCQYAQPRPCGPHWSHQRPHWQPLLCPTKESSEVHRAGERPSKKTVSKHRKFECQVLSFLSLLSLFSELSLHCVTVPESPHESQGMWTTTYTLVHSAVPYKS